MLLQFQSDPLGYLQKLICQKQAFEQTQELRLPDGMPDIGNVIGAWGQVLLRSKQWNGNSIGLSAGCMVWILYRPEEGGLPCGLETWIPFQQKFDLPDTQGREGTIHCNFSLNCVDVRSTSARKLFIRVCVDTAAEAMVEQKAPVYRLEDVPEDVQILKKTYPIVLPVEAGEKSFELEDRVDLSGMPAELNKPVYYKAFPKLQEKKVMGDKLIFRGNCRVHMLYLGQDDMLHSWDFEVPMSQYAELEKDYEPDAAAQITIVPTSMELEQDPQGDLQLNLGLVCQYVVRQRHMMPVIEDAYSTQRSVDLIREELPLPVILDQQEQKLTAQQTLQTDTARIVDTDFLSRDQMPYMTDDRAEMDLSGQFQTLGYDQEGNVFANTVQWQQPWSLPAQADTTVCTHQCWEPAGAMASGSLVEMESDGTMHVQTSTNQNMMIVSGLELGPELAKPKEGPSLVLRRAGNDGLWDVAKATGSTMDAIRKANNLEDEPEPGRLLLIPLR